MTTSNLLLFAAAVACAIAFPAGVGWLIWPRRNHRRPR